MNTTQKVLIIILIFGGFVATGFTKENIPIALMCMGIWLMQLLHETK